MKRHKIRIIKSIPLKLSIYVCSILAVLLISGCSDSLSSLDDINSDLILDLTGKEWERNYDGYWYGKECSINEVYFFDKNNRGYRRKTFRYPSGDSDVDFWYFMWTFITPDYRVINLNNACNWELKKITASELHVYEDNGSLGREYMEFTAKPAEQE